MTAAGNGRLLADVGGTNARFAWQARAGAPIEQAQVLPCADHASLADAIAAYLARVGRDAPSEAAIAIANPITGDQVKMTNHHWSFSIAALQAQYGFERLRVINDFTALALALPALERDEKRQVGGGAPVAAAACALIGPGTGLGVSGLVPDGRGGFAPIEGEGGHVTLAACTAREGAVLAQLAERYGHVSAERAISGQGLVDIDLALGRLAAPGKVVLERSAADISGAALAARGGDARAREALELFCAFLGTVAGNLALTLGARGGVYVGGGIVPRLGTFFDRSGFRERFEAKGRFAGYLAHVPVFVIQADPSPALRGAARALDG